VTFAVLPIKIPKRRAGDRFGLTEYIINSGSPLIIDGSFEERAAELEVQFFPSFGRLARPTNSYIGVPITAGTTALGVLSVQSFSPITFGENTVALLTIVASTGLTYSGLF